MASIRDSVTGEKKWPIQASAWLVLAACGLMAGAYYALGSFLLG